MIDNSSAWRMKENVPLVVPEVNPDDIRENEGIIANPNCCTIPLTVVLEPLRREAGIDRVLVSTYQSASGAGKKLVDELDEQTRAIASGRPPEVTVYPHQLAHNVVPGGWKPEQEGYNDEEIKVVQETRKILHEPAAKIYPTPASVAGKDEVYVGRIRNDLSSSRGLALWIVSDNVRKGAALNAVQIAERVLEMGVL